MLSAYFFLIFKAWCIMFQIQLGVRLILEKNASFISHFRRSFFACSFLVSQADTHCKFQKILPNVECTNQASLLSIKVKSGFTPVEWEENSMEIDTDSYLQHSQTRFITKVLHWASKALSATHFKNYSFVHNWWIDRWNVAKCLCRAFALICSIRRQ